MSPLAYYRPWTEAEIALAAEKWAEGVTLDDIAGGLSAKLAFLTTRKSLGRIVRKHADRFPPRARPMPVRRAPRARMVAEARKTGPVRQAIIDRCEKIVALWAQGIAPAVIAERAGCALYYVNEYARTNPDRCPPRTEETMPKGVRPVRDLSEFGIGKRLEWVRAHVPLATIDLPGKMPVSVSAFSWDAQA